MTRLIAALVVAMVVLAVGAAAQAPATAQEPSGAEAPPQHHASVADSTGTAASTPQLSMETRQQVQLMLTELELAETRIRLYERERRMILQQVQRVLDALQRPGYVLDLETLTYRPAEQPPAQEAGDE